MAGTARKPYPTDLTDGPWELMQVVIPDPRPGGRPRSVDMREVVNSLLYLNRAGCPWDMLPPRPAGQEGLRGLRGVAGRRHLAGHARRAPGGVPGEPRQERGADPGRRERRQPDGRGGRGRGRAGVRRGQEDPGPEAAHRG